MSDQSQDNPNDIASELHQLGQNLKAALRSAWACQERHKLQQEIHDGLSDLGNTLSQAAKDFGETPTGQSLKADLNDLQERLRTGAVENKVRSEILQALQIANRELKRATGATPPPAEPKEPDGEAG